MRRIFAGLLAAWVLIGPAFADSTIDGLSAGSAVQSTDIFPAYQGANPATGVSAAKVKTYTSTVGQRTNTTTTDTLTSSDFGNLVYENSASAVAVSWGSTFAANSYLTVCNINAGLATITPFSGTIGGAATFPLPGGSAQFPNCVQFVSDGTNYEIASQGTFGPLYGVVTTQSGTTYTLTATDCGTEIAFTNASAVTVTIPAALTTGCNISILQTTASGQVTVTGTAVSAATLHSAHTYTKTFGQWAVIAINIYTTGVAILTGDGA